MTKHSLQAHLDTVLQDLLLTASSELSSWSRLVLHLKHAGLTEIVRFSPWSKFPFVREALPMDRLLVMQDSAERKKVSKHISSELLTLFERDMPAESIFVLLRITATQLDSALEKLWLNQLTARRVAQTIVAEAIDPALDAVFSKIEFLKS